MKKICGIALLLLASNMQSMAGCQPKNELVGTWKLRSATSRSVAGTVDHAAFGPNPTGFLTFTQHGRMSFIAADANRRPLSVLDRVTAPVAERAQAFATVVAYAGRYTISGLHVIYHVEVSTIQNWVGSDLTRSMQFRNHQLILTTPITQKGGVRERIQLVFERVE